MKGFFKSVLATIVGILISSLIMGVICAILFFGFIGILLSSSSDSFTLKENSVLSINMNGIMKDRTNPNPWMEYLGLVDTPEMSLSDMLSAIEKAKDNKDIKGIYIRSGYFSAPSASLTELRKALVDFKTSGKFIVAYADNYMQGGYFVASVADKVILNPEGSLDLHGLSAGPIFYKGLLEKVGIEMQIFKVGTYKSAVEPYILDKMSDANREQMTSFTSDIWKSILTDISKSRNLSVEKLNQLTDTLPALRSASFVVENKLADTLMYETEAQNYIRGLLGLSDSDDINIASVDNMLQVNSPTKTKTSDEIAVLYAEGSIVSGNSKEDINDRYIIKQIEALRKDENVKAVVFRINSPGGSAYASEQIWKAITDLKVEKPVIVSMGGYAASGGYYIASNATKIFAEPTTLTGSIGIFGMFPNTAGLTQKIGLTFDNVKTNKFSDFGDITRPMTADEKAIIQQYIERGYDLFLTRCSTGRNIPKEKLAQIAEGRVWTGNQALENGLVDAIGGMDDAILEAAKTTHLTEYKVAEYPKLPSPFEAFMQSQQDGIAASIVKEYLGTDFHIIKSIKEIKDLKEQDFIQARIPYDLQIK